MVEYIADLLPSLESRSSVKTDPPPYYSYGVVSSPPRVGVSSPIVYIAGDEGVVAFVDCVEISTFKDLEESFILLFVELLDFVPFEMWKVYGWR